MKVRGHFHWNDPRNTRWNSWYPFPCLSLEQLYVTEPFIVLDPQKAWQHDFSIFSRVSTEEKHSWTSSKLRCTPLQLVELHIWRIPSFTKSSRHTHQDTGSLPVFWDEIRKFYHEIFLAQTKMERTLRYGNPCFEGSSDENLQDQGFISSRSVALVTPPALPHQVQRWGFARDMQISEL